MVAEEHFASAGCAGLYHGSISSAVIFLPEDLFGMILSLTRLILLVPKTRSIKAMGSEWSSSVITQSNPFVWAVRAV